MKKLDLQTWRFSIESLHFNKEVTLPHTWNVDDCMEVQLYRGEAEYETTLQLNTLPEASAMLYFGCAYHTADVYVNDHLAGRHSGSGNLPFRFEVLPWLHTGENTLRVVVNNQSKEEMLPHALDYDWADDGGLTRNVTLTLFEADDLRDLTVAYDLSEMHDSLCSGSLHLTVQAKAQNVTAEVLDCRTNQTVLSLQTAVDGSLSIPFANLTLWSTENPQLYVVRVSTKTSVCTKRIGLRTIAVSGTKVLLNGKELYLKGCEWMPGSHPDYGMAEPLSHSIKCLSQLKDAGCVFTRFHWQQDTTIFDWCDENGLLVQEEIPYWGHPKKSTPLQLEIAKKQADAMVTYHAHHPSIVCWGVGNELGAAFVETIDYVKQIYQYFKALDPTRLVNYVSNTISRDDHVNLDDATLYGDIAMWNEYLGLWQPCDDVEQVIRRTYKKIGEMPSMVTEFGLCEPAFSGGDKRRAEILLERIPIYKSLPNMVGYVWFSLNDYRTHCGEYGVGKLKQRIHGSTNLYAEEKPSYAVLKQV